MTHLGKDKSTDVLSVKERITHRFLQEHSMLRDNAGKYCPDYESTPLEHSGTYGRLIFFEREQGFSLSVQELRKSINYLLEMLESEEEERRMAISLCISHQLDLLRLFEWLDAYGPRRNFKPLE